MSRPVPRRRSSCGPAKPRRRRVESQFRWAPEGSSFPSPSMRSRRDSPRRGPNRTTLAASREASAGTVVRNQPVDHILVDLDLPLFDQHVLHAGFEQRVALAGALALDLVANDGALSP